MSNTFASDLKVAVNLTRLISGRDGSGGAGWFALYLTKTLSEVAQTFALVQSQNIKLVQDFLGDNSSVELIEFSGNFEKDAFAIIDEMDIYFDPLNGLEPKILPKKTFVVSVIHDLLFNKKPFCFTQKEIDFRTSHYGSAIDRADLVLTVSEREVENIKTEFGVNKVKAIIQPPYFKLSEETNVKHDGKTSYLIYPSVQWNHKNHFRLFEAFLHLCDTQQIPDHVKLVVSKVLPVEANTILHRELFNDAPNGHRILELPYFNKQDYAGVMQNALGVVFPSLYEGYGIPLVEAVANGMPILTADIPANDLFDTQPEAVSYFSDVYDSVAMAKDLAEFINNTPQRVAQPDMCPDADDFKSTLMEVFQMVEKQRHFGAERRIPDPANWPTTEHLSQNLKTYVYCESEEHLREVEEKYQDIHALLGEDVQISLLVPIELASIHSRLNVLPLGMGGVSADVGLAYELLFSQNHLVLFATSTQFLSLNTHLLNDGLKILLNSEDHNTCSFTNERANYKLNSALWDYLCGRVLRLSGFNFNFSESSKNLLRKLQDQSVEAQISDKKKFLLIDPSLKNLVGHHAAVARSMIRGAKLSGYDVRVSGNVKAPISLLSPDADVAPHFTDYLYEWVRDIGLFTYELENTTKFHSITGGDLVSLFCATPAMLAGVIPYLLKRNIEDRPVFSIRFDRDESRTPGAIVGYKQAFKLIKDLGLRQNFIFFAESEGLQDYFEKLSQERFPILLNPIANPSELFGQIGLNISGHAQKDKIILGYLGEARLEKGFQVLPFIVDFLLNQEDIKHKIQFEIQVASNPHNEHSWILSAKSTLKQMAAQYPNIKLHEYLNEDEYVDLMNKVDILVMPYGPGEYAIRGSGVATEAIALGKTMVVSKGIDIGKTFSGAGVVEPDVQHELGLAEACAYAVRNIERLVKRSITFKQNQSDWFGNDQHFFKRLSMQTKRSLVAKEGRFVLWISNDTRGQGSGIVYDAQLAYLRERGFTPIQLVIPYPNWHRAEQKPDFDWGAFLGKLEWTPCFKSSPEFKAICEKFSQEGNSYDNFYAAWQQLEYPEVLEKFLKTLKFEFAIINYAHHKSVLKTLNVPDDLPLIVETHDIQSYQYAIQQKRTPSSKEISQEIEALKAFNHLVNISSSETEALKQNIPADQMSWCLPFYNLNSKMLLQKQDADNDNSEQPNFKANILVVGSEHDANVISIEWFITQVYKPILYDLGFTLNIIGNVCFKLDNGFLNDQIQYLGPVEDLTPYYEGADVVALPVISGAGVPIKVLDCFARNKAFSLTSFPAKAIGLPSDFPTVGGAVSMGDDIKALLKDAKMRQKRALLGKKFYDNYASKDHYFETWDYVLKQCGIRI